MEDTIAAISTSPGQGGIAIIRISGPQALQIADAVFVSSSGRPSGFLTHTIHLGGIGTAGAQLDQVLLVVMRAPRTYTMEDVIEINCHGGLLTAKRILALCLQCGARLAEPGEFTKRAFLNGRLDLTQAEAVMDVISAKTERAHVIAEHALEGRLSRKVEEIRQQLLTVLAHIEAHIDFPDEDISTSTRKELEISIAQIIAAIEQLVTTASEGKILREGISIAIFGRPNVGKSSLMNALLGEERSIVASSPGTTRDTIEESVNIRGIPIKFTDTAGMRRPRGKAEKIGIDRSRNMLRRSDIGIHVLDFSRPLSSTDIDLAKLCEKQHVINVLNKVDLPRKLFFTSQLRCDDIVEVSAMTGHGVESLKDRIEHQILRTSTSSADLEFAINDRHSDALQRTIQKLKTAFHDVQFGASAEIVAQQVRIGLDAIGEIVGQTTTEDLLERIFSKFCIGK